jgi:hypothetical protein
MATIKSPDLAGESACSRSGTVITLSGTALTRGRTFAEAAADANTDFDDTDSVVIAALDASGNFEVWNATWSSSGGTLTRVSIQAAHGTLGTSGLTVYAVKVDDLISPPASDGNYYAFKDGDWVSITNNLVDV